MTKTAVIDSETKFIPTLEEWGRLYRKGYKQIIGPLWKLGKAEAVEDAVEDAFLKVSGLSANRELEGELEPRTEAGWYAFVQRQAKWILGQEREKDQKWKSEADSVEELIAALKDIAADVQRSPHRRELELRRHRQLMGYLVELEGMAPALPSDGLDERHCRDAVRNLVAEVCREAGVSDRNREAFVLYVLDEEPTDCVIARVWGVPASLTEAAERRNNLYVIKNRIMRRLQEFAAKWRGGGRTADEYLAAA